MARLTALLLAISVAPSAGFALAGTAATWAAGSPRAAATPPRMQQQQQIVDGVRIGPPPDLPSLLLNNRIVYLGMPIGGQVTELILSELLFLQYDSPSKPILMYINSPGTTNEEGMPVGYETEAFAIADTMAYVEPEIHTVLVGKAYGLAAMLLACGEKGHRSALQYGTVMLHQPRGWQMRGQASDISIHAKEVLMNRRSALEITSKASPTGPPLCSPPPPHPLPSRRRVCPSISSHRTPSACSTWTRSRRSTTASSTRSSRRSPGLGTPPPMRPSPQSPVDSAEYRPVCMRKFESSISDMRECRSIEA